MTHDHHASDRDLDELIGSLRRAFVDRNDARFDFEAGLADVRERAGQLGAVGAAIDAFVALLGEVMVAREAPVPAGMHIQRVAEVLLQMRDHVAAGTMSPAAVAGVFADVGAALRRADELALLPRLTQLEREVTTALARGRDLNANPASTSQRRGEGDQPGRRTAGTDDR
jgi:hypothetical protein